MSTGRLTTHVHVRDDTGRTHVFGPADQVPEWAARKITNPAAWAEPPVFDEPAGGGPPASSGRPAPNATKEVWLAYAAVRRIPIPAGATKQQVVDAVTAAEDTPADENEQGDGADGGQGSDEGAGQAPTPGANGGDGQQ